MSSCPSSPLRSLALAACDASALRTPPPAWLEADAQALAPAMPPDLSPRLLAVPLFRWLQLASVLDFAGDLRGARLLLDRLEARGPGGLPPALAAELLALICARRGRLARQVGEFDAAADWYQEGLARSDGARDGDAWGACVQGLANAAQARGDLRTAERLARLVTRQHDRVPPYARVAAWLTRAVLHRQQGRLALAAHCAWQAHDLVEECDERRGMALNEVSQLALALGQIGAARRGFDVVLGFAQTLRVRRPARSGLLKAALVQWHAVPTDSAARANVAHVADTLLADIAHASDPWQRVHGQLDALEAYIALSQRASPHDARARARVDALQQAIAVELATRARQGEPLPWAEQRLAALAQSAALDAALTAPAARVGVAVDARAFARLAALPMPSRARRALVGA
jgi:tetratricopeptide (TPR) repeat protein